jgi:cold shock CspA family protein
MAGCLFRGTVAASAEAGFGFIEPDDGGGQLLVRARSIHTDRELCVGDVVGFRLARGSFALEAVDVSLLQPHRGRRW